MNDLGVVVPVGVLGEFHMKRVGENWSIWVTSRTGPNGRDQHRFTVKHDELGQWFTDMLEAEANK